MLRPFARGFTAVQGLLEKKGDVLMLFLKNQQWSKDYDEGLSDAGNDKGYEREGRPLYILMKTVRIGHWSVTIWN